MPSYRWIPAAIAAASACVTAEAAPAAAPAIVEVVRIVTGPAPLDGFRWPCAVAVDPSRGFLAVADAGNHRLVLFDESGRVRGTVTSPGEGRGRGEPRAIAIDERGRLFVVDGITHRIHVLNGRGSVLAEIHPELPPGTEDNTYPQDIALGAGGDIYLLCAGEHPGVLVLDPRGNKDRAFGFIGAGSPFHTPVSVAVNRDESRIAVADPGADHEVVVLDAAGAVILSFGGHSESKEGFSLAIDVTWGPGETLWVTDTIRHSVSVFTAEGTYLGRLGGWGGGPGQFDYPAGCEFIAPDRIVVVERAGARFQVLEVTPPYPADADLGSAGSGEPMFKEEDQL